MVKKELPFCQARKQHLKFKQQLNSEKKLPFVKLQNNTLSLNNS